MIQKRLRKGGIHRQFIDETKDLLMSQGGIMSKIMYDPILEDNNGAH